MSGLACAILHVPQKGAVAMLIAGAEGPHTIEKEYNISRSASSKEIHVSYEQNWMEIRSISNTWNQDAVRTDVLLEQVYNITQTCFKARSIFWVKKYLKRSCFQLSVILC